MRTRPAGRVNKCGHIHDNARYAEDGTDEITSPSDSKSGNWRAGMNTRKIPGDKSSDRWYNIPKHYISNFFWQFANLYSSRAGISRNVLEIFNAEIPYQSWDTDKISERTQSGGDCCEYF